MECLLHTELFFVEKRFIFLLFHNAAFSFVCFVSFFFQRNYFIFLLWDSNSLETFFYLCLLLC